MSASPRLWPPSRAKILWASAGFTVIGFVVAVGFGIAWRHQVSVDRAFRRTAVPVRGAVIAVTDRSRTDAPLEVEVSYRLAGRSFEGPIDLSTAVRNGRYEVGSRAALLVDPARPEHPRLAEQAAGADARDDRSSTVGGIVCFFVAGSVHILTRREYID